MHLILCKNVDFGPFLWLFQRKMYFCSKKNNGMKRIDYILIGLLAISSLTACTEKKKSNIIIAPKPVAKVVNKATQKMSDYEQTREADWVGSHYKVVVKRSSDKELPVLQLDKIPSIMITEFRLRY